MLKIEERKTLRIGLSTFFLALAIIVIIIMACYIYIEKTNSNDEIAKLEENVSNMQNTIEHLQEEVNSKPNTNNSNTVHITIPTQDVQDKTLDNKVDETVKKLFEKGSKKIRQAQYSESSDEYDVAGPETIKIIGGIKYIKANVLYSDVKKEYSELFTGDALEAILNKRFIDVDGYLYISIGGATGWDIKNVEISRISESSNKIEYLVKYNDVYIDDSVSEKKSCKITVELVDGNYKISSTDYCDLNKNN